MFPVDVVKTRMQALQVPGQPQYEGSIRSALRTIVRSEGPRTLWRGVSAVALGAAPSHAVHFAAYEVVKHRLGGGSLASGVAGGCAAVLSDAIHVPADCVKQRMQLFHSPYRSVPDAVMRILSDEGIGAFYRSYPTTLFMNIPFFFTQLYSYEYLKRLIHADDEAPGVLAGLYVHGVAGGISGALAAAITTPLDVAKTRLQCQGATLSVLGSELATSKYKSLTQTLAVIYKDEGMRGLFSGIKPRVFFFTPAAAISWAVYEMAKKLLIE